MARQRLLFSCVGTTDPVRGQRDGGMMHIARRYKPDKIRLFLSAEMEKNIPLYEQAFAFMGERWGYAPEVRMVKSGIEDPSDLDALDQAMRAAFEAFVKDCPDAEILVNLSSGTPQMEIILSQLALSKEVIGIQVKSPEKKAGTAERTNSQRYNPEEELQCNQDEFPGAPNRCVVPELFPIHRERMWQEVRRLLERRDYAAVLERENTGLSPELLDIVRHLRARELLQDEEARAIAAKWPEEIRQKVNPYPCKTETDLPEYWRVADYWLIMKNMLRTGRYSDFLFRLSVLALYLAEAELKAQFAKAGLSYDAVTRSMPEYEEERGLSMNALKAADAALYERFCATMKSEPRDDRSVFLYTRLLRCMETPEDLKKFFKLCDKLTWKRNNIAHRMYVITESKFIKAVKKTPQELEQDIERVIAAVYPQCDEDAFALHERALSYIESRRR